MCHKHYLAGAVFVTEDSNSRGHSCNSVLKLSRGMKTSIVKTGKFLKTQTRCRKKDIHSTINSIGKEGRVRLQLSSRCPREDKGISLSFYILFCINFFIVNLNYFY